MPSPAAAYGNSLAAELQKHATRRLTKGGRLGEVLLLEALADAFASAKASRVLSEVYHGWSHQVSFTQGAQGHRCELCDLLIVAVASTHPLDARMTLLQAKFERRVVPKGAPNNRFAANMVQRDLLGRRPDITGCGGFNPPPDLLSGAARPSVGSFGFLFASGNNNYELVYASADTLAPANPNATGRYRDVTVNALPPRGEEVVFSPSTAEFGKSLAELRIGTPVPLWAAVDGGDNTARWLIDVLDAAAKRPEHRGNQLAAELVRSVGEYRALVRRDTPRRLRDIPHDRALRGERERATGRRPPPDRPRGDDGARDGGGAPTLVLIRTEGRLD